MTITVVDDDNNPVEGATVELDIDVDSTTVSVTANYGGEPVENAIVLLSTEPFTGSNYGAIVGGNMTGSDGSCTLKELDMSQNPPFGDDAEVDYGDYYLSCIDNVGGNGYEGIVSVDAEHHNFDVTLIYMGVILSFVDEQGNQWDNGNFVFLKQNGQSIYEDAIDNATGTINFGLMDYGTYDIEVTDNLTATPSSITVDDTHRQFTITLTGGD